MAKQSLFFQPLQLPMQRGTGDVHHQRPFGHGAGDRNDSFTALRRLRQQIECNLLIDPMIGQQLQPLLQHVGDGRDLKEGIFHQMRIPLQQTKKIVARKHQDLRMLQGRYTRGILF